LAVGPRAEAPDESPELNGSVGRHGNA
jgi:hypothetical protein